MELADFYPAADKLMKQEVAVLNFLRNDPYIKEKHNQFAADAATYFGRNKNTSGGFEFFSYFDVSHDMNQHGSKNKPNLRLIVAARIELEGKVYRNVTYCLSVCRCKTFAILRKFHFDITADASTHGARTQKHPRCHVQYCGKMIPQMQQMGMRQTQLDALHPWLSEPRIFSFPMSLALLVDMTLHEFPDSKSEKFRAAPEWRAIIREHERTLLTPFFDRCIKVIKNHDGSGNTLADAFYVG